MEVPFKGTLSDVPFPAIFAKIAREKKSGVLSLADMETKKVRKRMGFRGGNQVYVVGGTINETLGRLLMKLGKISEQQYHDTLAQQKANDQRTGETLIALKILDPPQLAEALQIQTEEKILGCFAWPDGIYSFVEAKPPNDKQLIFFQIRPEKVIMEGLRRYFNQERLDTLLKPYQNTKFRHSANFSELQQKVGFAPREARIVQMFKDGFGIVDLLAASTGDAVSTLQVSFAMLILGMIEPEGAAAARLQPQPQPQVRPQPQTQPRPQEQPGSQPQQPPTGARPAPRPEPVNQLLDDTIPSPSPAPKSARSPGAEQTGGARFAVEGEEGAEAESEPVAANKTQPVRDVRKTAEQKKEETAKKKEIAEEISKYEKMIQEGTLFDLLGINRDAKPPDVKKAFFRLAKKFHPDTNPLLFQSEYKERAEEVFTRIGGAYNTLIDLKAREEYVYALDHKISQEDLDKANRALEAEGVFVKAEILFKKGDFRGAQTIIQEAINLNPEEPEYYLYLGWCLFKSTHGVGIAEAKKNLQKAIDMGLRDKMDMAQYYLGMLAKVEGRSVEEQRRYFSAAIEANPQNTLAASELRHIDMRGGQPAPPKKEAPEKKKGGFFSRFKK